MFFDRYFPGAKATYKSLIPKIVVNISPHRNLCMEIATAQGTNIRRLLNAGWKGKVIGYDLWAANCSKPIIKQAELIQGNILDTLVPSYNGELIDILFLDLDGNPITTAFTLEVLVQGLRNSLIYVDEFHGSKQWQRYDANVLAIWLAQYDIKFDIVHYTKYGVLIQTGKGYPPSYLLECLKYDFK